MSPERLERIIAAGVRNRALREGQIERLQPARALAAAKQAELRQRAEAMKPARENLATMERLRCLPNFYPTPRALVARMLEEAGSLAGRTVLEPSAGKGDIARAALAAGAEVQGVELVHDLAALCRKAGLSVQCADFLDLCPADFPSVAGAGGFDCVLMNPPFERGACARHVLHAFAFLRPGGRLVAITSSTTGARLEEWAAERGGFTEQLPADAFHAADRPTDVRTALVIADRGTP